MFFHVFDLFCVIAKSSCAETEKIVLKLCSFFFKLQSRCFLGLIFFGRLKEKLVVVVVVLVKNFN